MYKTKRETLLQWDSSLYSFSPVPNKPPFSVYIDIVDQNMVKL